MRAFLASLLLACLFLLLAPASSAASLSVQGPLGAGVEENKPPKIEGVAFVRWPELVGELVVGYVNASDPEGEEVSVMGVFLLQGEWAEGVPGEQRIHNITGVPDPGHGPNCFKIVANTSGWLPGTYKVMIVAKDPLGHKSTYEYERKLTLRMELVPPPEARRWALVGLGVLACLLVVMVVGVIKAVKAKARPRARGLVLLPPGVPSPLPPELY